MTDTTASMGQRESAWSYEQLEAATLRGQSLDPVLMALDLIEDRGAADEFLQCVYNWQWLAPLKCMAEAVRSHDMPNFSREIEVALLAVVSEKVLDPVLGTRRQAGRAIDNYPGSRWKLSGQAFEFDELVRVVRNEKSTVPWFQRWQKLFARVPPEELETWEWVGDICSANPILGWTAANVVRRFALDPATEHVLREMYDAHALSGSSASAASIRWRVVHALGKARTTETIDLLFTAINSDPDPHGLVQYGAARGVTEIAATTEAVQSQVVERLRSGLAGFGSRVWDGIGNAVFHSNEVGQWRAHARSLLEAICARQGDPRRQELWRARLADFDSWTGSGYV